MLSEGYAIQKFILKSFPILQYTIEFWGVSSLSTVDSRVFFIVFSEYTRNDNKDVHA